MVGSKGVREYRWIVKRKASFTVGRTCRVLSKTRVIELSIWSVFVSLAESVFVVMLLLMLRSYCCVGNTGDVQVGEPGFCFLLFGRDNRACDV